MYVVIAYKHTANDKFLKQRHLPIVVAFVLLLLCRCAQELAIQNRKSLFLKRGHMAFPTPFLVGLTNTYTLAVFGQSTLRNIHPTILHVATLTQRSGNGCDV